MKKQTPCKDCNGTGRYDAWTGPLTPRISVPCPCKLGLKVMKSSDFRRGQPGFSGQVDIVAAVKSLAEFSRLSGISRSYLREYGDETGNGTQIAAAMSKPHAIFWRPCNAPDSMPYLEKDWS